MGSETMLKRGISPGPWLYLVSPHCEPDERGVTQISFGRSVFDIDGVPYTNFMPPTGEDGFVFSPSGYCTEDDARLICAAPDLYEALTKIMRVAEGVCCDMHSDSALDQITNLAEAALAKACPTPAIASQGSPSTDDDAGKDT